MVEIKVLVEGETEQTFVRDVLQPHLGGFGASIWAVLPGRRNDRGGVKKWESAKGDLVRLLKQRLPCTTMFDYYAMPLDWPGRRAATSLPWNERAAHVESCIRSDLAAAFGGEYEVRHLIPYVQLHEFEALLFAGIVHMADVLAPIAAQSASQLTSQFQKILDEKGEPEAIDDSRETCPSRRITNLVAAYKKRTNGPIIATRIGLSELRQRCPHFSEWVGKLEAVAGG